MKYLDRDNHKKFIDNDLIYKEDVYIPDTKNVGFEENFKRDCLIDIPESKILNESANYDEIENKSLSEYALFNGYSKYSKIILESKRSDEFDSMFDDLQFALKENCMNAVVDDFELVRGYMDDCYALKLMEAENPNINNCIKYFEAILEAINNNELLQEWKSDKFLIEDAIKNKASLGSVMKKFCPPSSKGCQKHIEATGVPGCVGTQKADGLKKDMEKSGVDKNVLLEPEKQLLAIEDRSLDEDIWN